MKKEYFYKAAVVIIIPLAAFLIYLTVVHIDKTAPVGGNIASYRTIVIDPGHGGSDGGAVGYSGSIEKDMNLDISLKLRDLLKMSGFNVLMTREDDRSIHDEDAGSVGAQKRSDLYNRLDIYNADPTALVISVHLNKYEESSVHGAQIFYSPNLPASKEFAQSVQSAFVNQLQPDNKRMIKPAEKNLFLLFHAEVPAILCECGFVSNPTEEGQLMDAEYRSEVAFTIFTGLMDYLLA